MPTFVKFSLKQYIRPSNKCEILNQRVQKPPVCDYLSVTQQNLNPWELYHFIFKV